MFKKSIFTLSSQDNIQLPDAPDKPPVKLITTVVLLSFVFVAVVASFSFPFVRFMSERQQDKVDLGMANPERLEYIAQQELLLSTTKRIDHDHMQIPIKRAMSLVVEKQGRVFE